jgi:transposase
MQKSTTIIGVLEMLGDGFSYNDIRTRYAIGNSTITDINKKFKAMDVTLKQLHSITEKLIIFKKRE